MFGIDFDNTEFDDPMILDDSDDLRTFMNEIGRAHV